MSYNNDSNKGATVQEIKDRCNIVDIIGRVVNLKKAGSNYKGLCPFHSEKTPSFVVSETKQYFTCFGCQKSGDVFTFMQEYYNMDFVQAAEKLADECGLTFKRFSGGDARAEKIRNEMYEMNRQAARFFYRALRERPNPGLPYMYSRGVSDDVMRIFGIGWADEKWDSLYRHMKGLGFSDEQLIRAGLISYSENRKNYYDKFRERVIFPIQNTSGKVIGFGGRAMGDAMPKYLNSQESDVFKKKNNLYGLNITRQDISREDQAILVEGYMDVIGLYQSGVRNVSASLGTALTENQAKMLKRYTSNIVLSYDADEAGQKAALRGMDILRDEGCRVHVLKVTDGKDPDEFVKKRGKEAFLDLARNAMPFADFKLDIVKRNHDMTSLEGRIEYLKDAVKILSELSPVEADMYIRKIAADNDISEGAIRAEMQRGDEKAQNRSGRHEGQVRIPPSMVEQYLIKVLLTDSSYMENDNDLNNVFKTPSACGI
ncbi:MAG: DNA primase, partial [Anaerovoracaceae bacterium]|nr:DNA primase [Anaerovoracaceae bacterium]